VRQVPELAGCGMSLTSPPFLPLDDGSGHASWRNDPRWRASVITAVAGFFLILALGLGVGWLGSRRVLVRSEGELAARVEQIAAAIEGENRLEQDFARYLAQLAVDRGPEALHSIREDVVRPWLESHRWLDSIGIRFNGIDESAAGAHSAAGFLMTREENGDLVLVEEWRENEAGFPLTEFSVRAQGSDGNFAEVVVRRPLSALAHSLRNASRAWPLEFLLLDRNGDTLATATGRSPGTTIPSPTGDLAGDEWRSADWIWVSHPVGEGSAILWAGRPLGRWEEIPGPILLVCLLVATSGALFLALLGWWSGGAAVRRIAEAVALARAFQARRGQPHGGPVRTPEPLNLEVGELTRVIEQFVADARCRDERIRSLEQDRFDRVVYNLPGIAYRLTVGADWHLSFVSDRIAELVGVSAEEFLAANTTGNFWSLLPASHRKRMEKRMRQAVTEGNGWDLEYPILRTDGELLWVNDRAQVVPVADGRDGAVEVHGIWLDISARVEASQRLEFTQEVVDSAHESIYWVDFEEDHILYVNDRFCEVLGYSREELLKMSLPQVAADYEPGQITEMRERLMRDGQIRFEALHRRRDGHLLSIEIVARLMAFEERSIVVCFARDISAQKAAREALTEAEMRARRILDSAGDGIYEIDCAGRALFLNERTLELFGVTADEVIGRRIVQLSTKGRHAPHKDSFIFRTLEDGVIRHGKRELVWSRSGQSMYVDVTVAPTFRDGEIVGAVITFRDVTRAVEVESDLRALLENSEDYIYFKDASHSYSAMSQKLVQLNGYEDFEKLRGKDEFTIFPASVARRMREEEVALMRAGEDQYLDECRWLNPRGIEIWTKVVRKVLRNDKGEVIGQFTVGNDITDLKRARDQLARNDELLRGVVNNIQAILVVKDVEGRYLIVNRQFEENTGFRREKVIGRHDRDLFPVGSWSAIELHNRIAVADDRPVTYDVQIPHLDGLHRSYSATVAPLRNSEGQVSGTVTVAHDVTERDAMERDLVRARDAAAAANAAKSEFLANMSHEIRTPLNAVIGFSELLEGEVSSEKASSYLRSVRHSADTLLDLINDVLDLAKVEAGKMELRLHPLDLVDLVEETMAMLRVKALEKGLDLEVRVLTEMPHLLEMDEVRMRQVLLNLLGNAVKFTHDGGVAVELRGKRLEESPEATWSLEIAVIDTGIGIPFEEQERIFEVFEQRAGAKVLRSVGGTGLGLAITRRLAHLMGGRVEVRSTVSEGSCFTVYLPRVRELAEGEFSSTLVESTPPSDYVFAKKRLLVIDDIRSNRAVVRGHLEAVGMVVDEAATGEVGLHLMRENPPDVVLLDLRMPGMDGIQVAEAMSADPALADLAVIGFTASTVAEEESQFSKYCDAFLRKPVRRRQLLRAVAEVLKLPVHPPAAPALDEVHAAAVTEPSAAGDLPEETSSGLDDAVSVEFLSVLEGFVPTTVELSETLAINEIIHFAGTVADRARAEGAAPWVEWAGALQSNAELLEIDEVVALLKSFAQRVAHLRDRIEASPPHN
jgi:PAS domain S-box-containing protein